jgi:hypothetical protein
MLQNDTSGPNSIVLLKIPVIEVGQCLSTCYNYWGYNGTKGFGAVKGG